MKLTNYENSKKLAEIGFDCETNFHYLETKNFGNFEVSYSENNNYNSSIVKAYDLETLLDAMPLFTEVSGFIGGIKFKACRIEITQSGKAYETLADSAALFLISLYEKGIIKFKK